MIGSGLIVFNKIYKGGVIRRILGYSCNNSLPIQENLTVDIWFGALGISGCHENCLDPNAVLVLRLEVLNTELEFEQIVIFP